MDRAYTVVMLAGGLQPSPLMRQLEIPLMCLPLGPQGTLLGAWFAAIGRTPGGDIDPEVDLFRTHGNDGVWR